MRKQIIICAICFMLLFLCSCGNETKGSELENTVETLSETYAAADGYDLLGGQLWEVGGIYYRGKIIDIHDNSALEDLYDTTFLSFSADGSFMYLDLFPKQGTYKRYSGDGVKDYFLLNIEKTLKYDSEIKEFVEIESDQNADKTYIIAVLDDHTIEFVEFDSFTGRAKANEDPLLFVKSEDVSNYISDNKTQISSEKNSSTTSNNSSQTQNSNPSTSNVSKNSYQAILDDYTAKMENNISRLVREYQSESSGISDISRLAEICNNKVGELAEICNEGIGKMADLMYSKGDAYSTYEMWAGKLQERYVDIAEEIQNAYLDSAIN